MDNKPWTNEELKKLEEALQRPKECQLERVSRLYKAKTRVRCDGFHTKVPLGLTKETRRKRNHRVSGESGAEREVAATSLYNDVLLDTEECYE